MGIMRVWPPGRNGTPGAGETAVRRARRHGPAADLAHWTLSDECLLIESRFDGDLDRYRAWRDRLWAEMHDTLHPGDCAHSTFDEEYVVRTAFGGDWAQYRICRDRLREKLWQIMKVTSRR